MSLTFEEANNDILALFKAAWDTTTYTAYYESVGTGRENTSDPWCAIFIRHAVNQQSTLGGIGGRQFMRTGTVIAQVYVPSGNGLQRAYQLAKIVADAYEGQSSQNGVWFRNVRINEVGKESEFTRVDVLTDFEYYELK